MELLLATLLIGLRLFKILKENISPDNVTCVLTRLYHVTAELKLLLTDSFDAS